MTMLQPQQLTTMALGVAMSFGHVVADGPGDEYGVREIGTVRFSDRALNLFQLENGTELHTTDPRRFQTFGRHPAHPTKVGSTAVSTRGRVSK
jgi:hypothetical protein